MRTSKTIHVVSAHAEGEVGDVIVGGVTPPPGDTLWEQSRWIARDGTLRDLLLNEPRGGVFRHVNLLVPAVDPRADAGFIVMEPVHTPPMSGSNSMCVATVLLETGILPMDEPVTELTLEAPGGLVSVRAECQSGMLRASKLYQSVSICGPSATAKPISARIAVTSSVTWLTGWIVPCLRSRAGSVTSSHSDRSLSSKAASASASFFAERAALISSFRALSAGPAVLRSSGVILPSSRIFRLTSPFLPTARTRSSSSVASSAAPAIASRYFCLRSSIRTPLELSLPC